MKNLILFSLISISMHESLSAMNQNDPNDQSDPWWGEKRSECIDPVPKHPEFELVKKSDTLKSASEGDLQALQPESGLQVLHHIHHIQEINVSGKDEEA